MSISQASRTVVFFVFQEHSVFIPLKFVYPECSVLIQDHPQVFPLACFGPLDSCPANVGCAEIIAKRINYLFEYVVPNSKQIIAYFKYRDMPDRIRAGVFDKALSNPRVVTVNPYAFKKFQREGTTMQWVATDSYLYTTKDSTILIPETSLIR